MKKQFLERLAKQTEELKENGLYKKERVITSQQQAVIEAEGKK